jgi:hypothetical protein
MKRGYVAILMIGLLASDARAGDGGAVKVLPSFNWSVVSASTTKSSETTKTVVRSSSGAQTRPESVPSVTNGSLMEEEETVMIEGCRELCGREEDQSPRCVDGKTYANICWFACSNKGLLNNRMMPPKGACAKQFEAGTACFVQNCGESTFDPVCGKTGETFSNSCYADCAGISYVSGHC